METLVEVKLIGELGRRFGRSYSFVASSPKEIISALSHQIEGFKDYLRDAHEKGIGFRLVDGDADGMEYGETMMGCKRLIIAPIITGGGAIGRILLGVALIALAFVTFGTSAAFAGFTTAAQAAATGTTAGFAAGSAVLFNLGVTLVLTGIAALLTPAVEPPKETERKDSFLFDRATELTTQGQPVPVLYGKFLAASPLIISSSLTAQQVPV
jgi:predicted phage tail protein